MNDLVSCSNVQCSDVPGSMQNYYQCQQDFCTAEYNACVNDGGANSSSSGGQYGSNGQNGGASDLNTCADVHYAVLDVCVPGYSTCMANCSTQSCSDACGEEINTCIENQQNEVTFAEAQNFQAVRDCRSENFDSCNTEADDGYDTCVAGCGSTDTACQDNCADEANDAYETCFADACSSEYATCGIGASGNATDGASQFTAEAHETCLEIWEANTDVCSPNYFQCLEGCSTDSCNEGCVEDYTGCMDAQKTRPMPRHGNNTKRSRPAVTTTTKPATAKAAMPTRPVQLPAAARIKPASTTATNRPMKLTTTASKTAAPANTPPAASSKFPFHRTGLRRAAFGSFAGGFFLEEACCYRSTV